MPREFPAYVLQGRDSTIVEEFIAQLPVMSEKRLEKHKGYLATAQALWLRKPFEECTLEDVKGFVRQVRASEEFEAWTKRDYLFIVKRFFRWLRDKDFASIIPVPSPESTVGPDDILTENELLRLEGVCTSVRDKALLSTMREGALRPHELLGMRKNDILFDDYGAKVHIRKGKTGPRTVRVVNAAPRLAMLIENHPFPERESPLWIEARHNRTPLRWAGLNIVVYNWTRKAAIEKDITAYIFRHTRLTELASWMTEAQMCVFAGWKIGSKMPRMYIHLSGRDVDSAILKSVGLVKQDPAKAQAPVPRRCPRCGLSNPATSEFCAKCMMSLTLGAAVAKDDELESLKKDMKTLLENPNVRRLLAAGGSIDPEILRITDEEKKKEGEDDDGGRKDYFDHRL